MPPLQPSPHPEIDLDRHLTGPSPRNGQRRTFKRTAVLVATVAAAVAVVGATVTASASSVDGGALHDVSRDYVAAAGLAGADRCETPGVVDVLTFGRDGQLTTPGNTAAGSETVAWWQVDCGTVHCTGMTVVDDTGERSERGRCVGDGHEVRFDGPGI
jgi:hypothetical protein